ncbi:Surface antigen [Nocardioides scoriae]|uniref:Surface antigen n=2 Tax=Nocardioides scoriae TaxID=642780 RepID=A0A1H1VLE9_9ACTN|nr:Surface antigen [Nocardioides scoriae]
MALWSRNGLHRAVMQGDGNFVVYGPAGAQWSTSTGSAGSSLALQSDGNLVVYAGSVATWSSHTAPARGVRLVMQDDGNLVMYSRGGVPVWSSRDGRGGWAEDTLPAETQLTPGQALWSHDGRFTALMQGDGNFVVYGPGGAQWASGTGVSGSIVRMQGDGNLVVYAPGAVAKWSSATQGAGARLVMQDDGNLVIYSGSTALWSSRGQGVSGPGTSSTTGGYPDADAVACQGLYAWCKNGSDYHPVRRLAYRNCTDYVAWKKGLVWGQVASGGSADATRWKAGWQERGREVGSTPRVGAVAWWGATSTNRYGHVAYVLAVNPDGSARIGEYNNGGTGRYSERNTRAQAYLY